MTTALKCSGLRSSPGTETSPTSSFVERNGVTSQTLQGPHWLLRGDVTGGGGASHSEGQAGPLTCQGPRTMPLSGGENARASTSLPAR